MPNSPRKRTLSEEELEECRRLKMAWEHFKTRSQDAGVSITQEAFADKLGWTQGNLGHYLNGRMALNLDALLKICAEVEVDPVTISPRLVALVQRIWPELKSTTRPQQVVAWPFDVPYESYAMLDAAQKRRLAEKVADFIDGASATVKSSAA